MTVLIRCRDCPVISLGKTEEVAREQFMWHDEFFRDVETHTGAAVGATETTASGIDTSTWETRADALESEQER